MAGVPPPAEAWVAAEIPPMDGGLSARRVEVAEMVQKLREAKAAEAAAQAVRALESGGDRPAKDMSKEQQMEVLFADMKKNGDGDKTSSFAQNSGNKVKGYRKQDNFGATKFIKP